MEVDTKAWWKSAGVWGSLVAVAAGGAGMLGYSISPEDQAHLVNAATKSVELGTAALSLFGGLVSLWGRIRATKRIG